VRIIGEAFGFVLYIKYPNFNSKKKGGDISPPH
jgi:hypothetical protein